MASGHSSLGVLFSRVVVDNPDRIHYGNEEAVTGNVTLRYRPKVRSHTTELFGPLLIQVTFQGVLKAVRGKEYSIAAVKLFSKTAKLHDGPFRADPDTDYQFSFSTTFPESADPRESIVPTIKKQADGSLRYGMHVTNVTVEDLPPTLSSRLSRSDLNLLGPAIGSACHIDVSYSISASIQMPGLDAVIAKSSEDARVLYELPKVPPAMVSALDMRSNVEMRMKVQVCKP